MRSIRIATATLLALVLVLAAQMPAAAQTPAATQNAKAVNVAGKWDLTWQSQRGPSTMTLNLTQNGTQVTGTASMRMNDVPIKDVTLNGNTLSFTVELGSGQRTVDMQYKATVQGDTMKGTMSTPNGGERAFTGKRASS